MYQKQFLLTNKTGFNHSWKNYQIGEFRLIHHQNLICTICKSDINELYLLGNIYAWNDIYLTNDDILLLLVSAKDIGQLLDMVADLGGEYIILFKNIDNLYMFHDATGQSEIYYDTDFKNFATQPKLLSKVMETEDHEDEAARDFYSSEVFNTKRLFVGNTTHYKNIKHLRPNHYLNITKKQVVRYFPVSERTDLPVKHVAKVATQMLKGYIEAAAERNKLAMAVTAGYDSRVLFLASLNTECKYFVFQHANMSLEHHDILIPQKLTALFNKEFTIIPDESVNSNLKNNEYINSIDFPRFPYFPPNILKDSLLINGNVSEIARNYFGYYKNATAADLAHLSGYTSLEFPIRQYQIWLNKNARMFKECGYNYLDMFYWEERMGNWAAKAKTEARAFGRELYSPFNSRKLLTMLLSVERKFRDAHFNNLYNEIIAILSDERQEVINMPVNPCPKQKKIRLMKKTGIYNIYRYIALKLRKLK